LKGLNAVFKEGGLLTGNEMIYSDSFLFCCCPGTAQDWASENSVTLPNVNNPTQRTTTSSYRWEEDPNSRHILQGHDEIVWAVEVSDRRLFSASADKTIRVWDITSRRCEQVLEDHTRPVLSLAVAGRRLFSGSYDFTIKVWDLDSLERVKTLEGHKDAVRALEVCNNLLFSGSYDGTVKVFSPFPSLLTRYHYL
jgi:F-box/WD-40 domain protein 7